MDIRALFYSLGIVDERLISLWEKIDQNYEKTQRTQEDDDAPS